MSRVPPFAPPHLNDQQLEVYRAMTSPARGTRRHAHPLVDADGALSGPVNAWLLNPGLGLGLERLGEAILSHLTLPARCKEIAILTVAAHRDSAFEFYAHRLAAESAGMSADEIDAIRTNAPVSSLADPFERAVLRITRLLLDHETLADDEFAEAREALGLPALFDLTVLVGHYRAIALQLAVFDVRPPDESAMGSKSREGHA